METIRRFDEDIECLRTKAYSAILTLAWGLRRRVNERFLLSGTVDLVPTADVPDFGLDLRRCVVSDNYFAFCRRYLMASYEGLTWYQNAANGNLHLPDVEGGHRLMCEALLPEPPWPSLQCSTETAVPGSCIKLPGRTACLVPMGPGAEAARITKVEHEETTAFLLDSLEFDFRTAPELLGAVHLVAVDPDLIGVHLNRAGATENGALFRIEARFRSPSVDGFTFLLRRYRPRGEESPIVVPLRDGTVIELPHDLHLFSYQVAHERRGLVYTYGPCAFMDGADFEIGFVTRARGVTVPKTRHRPEDRYDVPLVREVEHASTGSPSPQTAVQILAANRARREKRRAPYQCWFDGSADDAAPAIRSLLASTKSEAFVTDPYLDHREFLRFCLSVGRTEAPIRILSSAEGLRSGARNGDHGPGRELLKAVNEATLGPTGHSTVEVRVMQGTRPEVHDRFLAIDEWIWLLGSSLNEFGSRGTVLVALPDPDPVLVRLQEAWRRATPLADWVAERA